MSLAGTLKEMETQVAALNATLGERDKTIEAHVAKIEDLSGQINQHAEVLEKAKAEHADELKKTAEDHELTKSELKAAVEKTEQVQADLEKARKALSDPAFTDAAARGESDPPVDSGVNEDRLTDEQFSKAYDSETDPEKRARMWRERTA